MIFLNGNDITEMCTCTFVVERGVELVQVQAAAWLLPLALNYLLGQMELSTAAEGHGYSDRHPLLSLVSACFWVICELSNVGALGWCSSLNNSMALIMGQGSNCFRNNYSSTVHLLRTILLHDFDREMLFITLAFFPNFSCWCS
jgi:hypothetical protein